MRYVIILCMALAIMSCGKRETKFTTFGKEYDVILFADKQFKNNNEDLLSRTIGKPVFYTHTEDVYSILERDISEFNRYYKYKNILFIDDVETEDPVTVFLTDMLGKQQIADVTGVSIVHKEGVWLKNQNVIFILVRGDRFTKNTYTDAIKKAHEILDNYVGNRLIEQLKKEHTVKNITQDIQKKFGYELFLPYPFAKYKEAEHFYGIVARSPDRHISLSRWPYTDTNVTITSLIALRNQMAKEYYGGDTVNIQIFDWQKEDKTVQYQCGFERSSVNGTTQRHNGVSFTGIMGKHRQRRNVHHLCMVKGQQYLFTRHIPFLSERAQMAAHEQT